MEPQQTKAVSWVELKSLKKRVPYKQVLKLMLLRPSLKSYHSKELDYYCHKHNFEEAPSAFFDITTLRWKCNVCTRRGYKAEGDIYDLIKFTYGLKTKTECYNKLVFLIEFARKKTLEAMTKEALVQEPSTEQSDELREFLESLKGGMT